MTTIKCLFVFLMDISDFSMAWMRWKFTVYFHDFPLTSSYANKKYLFLLISDFCPRFLVDMIWQLELQHIFHIIAHTHPFTHMMKFQLIQQIDQRKKNYCQDFRIQIFKCLFQKLLNIFILFLCIPFTETIWSKVKKKITKKEIPSQN